MSKTTQRRRKKYKVLLFDFDFRCFFLDRRVEHFFSMCSLHLCKHDLISREITMAKEQTKTRAYAFVNAQLTLNVLAVS